MEMRELLEFTERVASELSKRTPNSTSTERVFARMVKLTEEVGELADEVLALHKVISGAEGLGDEIADVLITTLILAASLEVNVPEALARKITKIEARFYGDIR